MNELKVGDIVIYHFDGKPMGLADQEVIKIGRIYVHVTFGSSAVRRFHKDTLKAVMSPRFTISKK